MKRKRDSGSGNEADPRARIHGLLIAGKGRLGHALTVAKGFERLKMNRRIKTATEAKDEKAVARIHREIEAIKVCVGLPRSGLILVL
jgi:hypothetical protein